jgi:subtilisin family serine protease
VPFESEDAGGSAAVASMADLESEDLDLLALCGLAGLAEETAGRPEVVIGLIDGAVDASHPALESARLRTLAGDPASCQVTASPACQHGTFVAGMLCARRGAGTPALCPECTVLSRPIFCEALDLAQCPIVTPVHLAAALVDVVEAGARIVTMSLGLGSSALRDHPDLRAAIDFTFGRGALVICAAGNQGHVGAVPLFDHPWVLPVGACDRSGRPSRESNLGSGLGRRGLLAPGAAISSTPGGGLGRLSGTSVAAPWVTGAAALLWSLFPRTPAAELRRALLLPGRSRRSIIPPLLDAGESRRALAVGA